MRNVRRDSRGLSEIVGALMLIVIVISAAVALAAFVATEQKQLQAQEAAQQMRSLEDLKVLSVVPLTLPQSTEVYSINFTVTNLDVNPTTITGLRIDQQGVRSYNATEIDPTTGLLTWVTVADGGSLQLGGYNVVNIVIDGQVSSPEFSFFDSSFQLTSADYIEVELYTSLSNDFTQTFVPPTAIAVVSGFSEYTGSGYTTVPELDGTNSFQPENGTLVSWVWTVTYPTTNCPTDHGSFTASGVEVVVQNMTACPSTTYSITLSVENNYGLLGVSSTTYANP